MNTCLGCARTQARDWRVIDTSGSFLGLPLRRVRPGMSRRERAEGGEERMGKGGEREKDMTINLLSRLLSGRHARQLAEG